jgi:hypothetical protein
MTDHLGGGGEVRAILKNPAGQRDAAGEFEFSKSDRQKLITSTQSIAKKTSPG